MKKVDDEMREEYDFSGGERGRYADRYVAGSKAVVLDPDVATTLCEPSPPSAGGAERPALDRVFAAPPGAP